MRDARSVPRVVAIWKGGLPLLLRKLRTAVELLLALPVVLVARLLRPLVVIRFGALPSPRIGPLAASVELYLCERDAGLHGRRTLDMFYHILPVCNHQLKTMWDRTLRVWGFARSLDRVNRWLPGGHPHWIPMQPHKDRDLQALLPQQPPHLSFTPAEETQGRRFLDHCGVQEGVPFVCFQARDLAYLATVYPERNWDYHSYRSTAIHSYLPAMEELARRGYAAFRVGAVVQTPLRSTHPRIIDYATNGRTEFLDIYLGARCHFGLGDPSGILCIPMIFRRPRALVGAIPFEHLPSWGPHDVCIPKKLWLAAEHRFLTFREILESGIGRSFHRTEQYEQCGIEVIENTPEEITAVAVEMDERLKGTWRETEEDGELQRRFWALFAQSPLHGIIQAHIGAEFLRQHRTLLR